MFETVEATVRKVMSNEPKTRSNDKLLVCRVYEELGVNTLYTSFYDVMMLKGLPSTETITRCRRKIQEHGDLKSDINTAKARLDKMYEAERYALTDK